jgi:hypothetical protein
MRADGSLRSRTIPQHCPAIHDRAGYRETRVRELKVKFLHELARDGFQAWIVGAAKAFLRDWRPCTVLRAEHCNVGLSAAYIADQRHFVSGLAIYIVPLPITDSIRRYEQ